MATVDKIKVREVILFSENDYRLYEVLTTTYLDNLKKKRLKGNYDKKKSYKLLEYYYSNYVRPEMKKPSKYGYDPKLNKPEREMFAKYFGDYLWDEYIKNIRPKKQLKGVPKTKRKLKQGYDSRMDESLGMRKGASRTKKQSLKSRRDESKGMSKSMGRRAYASVRSMDKGRRTRR
jgi:hypothetical protein